MTCFVTIVAALHLLGGKPIQYTNEHHNLTDHVSTPVAADSFGYASIQIQSDSRLLGKREGIFHVHTEVSNGVLYLGMVQQDLDCPYVARGLVDDRRLGPTERVSARREAFIPDKNVRIFIGFLVYPDSYLQSGSTDVRLFQLLQRPSQSFSTSSN